MIKRTLFILSIGVICLFTNCKKKTNSTVIVSDTTLYKHLVVYIDTPFTLILPTAFTPNGDGMDDVYRVGGKNLSNDNFLLKVMRTNGDVVFQTTDPAIEWDGSVNGKLLTDYKLNVSIRFRDTRSGQMIDTGTYLYLLPAYSTSGCMQVPSGDIPKYFFEDQADIGYGGFIYPTGEHFCN